MESCMASSPAFANSSNKSQSSSHNNGHSSRNGRLPNGRNPVMPATPNKHVNFGSTGQNEEKKREKFLTAKYGAHQMALIRKRLRVEMWMYEKLQELYEGDDIEIDLDEVLDLDDDADRRKYINNLLSVGGSSAVVENVSVFVEDLLEKVKTL